jgi:hypothetical protein
MQLRSTFKSWLGVLLFLIGVLLGLGLSGSVTTGGSEAWLYTSNNADAGLRLSCPYMLAPKERGTVSAKIANSTSEEIKPVVTAQISHANLPREEQQTVLLKAKESKTVEWMVNSSDVIFEHLIIVNISQARYRDNPSLFGSCGILLFSLFGLSGELTFGLLLASSVTAMLIGGRLWSKERPQPLSEFSINLTQISKALMAITILALLSMFPRWWGLTLVLDALILLVTGVIFTDFLLLSKYKN